MSITTHSLIEHPQKEKHNQHSKTLQLHPTKRNLDITLIKKLTKIKHPNLNQKKQEDKPQLIYHPQSTKFIQKNTYYQKSQNQQEYVT